MYDKKKTIKGYMGGGYMKPMSYANGGYIPGLSSQMFGIGLGRDVIKAQEEFEEQAEKVAKEKKYRGILGKLGSFAGTALGALLAAPTGGMSVLAGKALGSAIGKGAGELVGGSLVDAGNIKESSTGLFKDDFDYLRKVGKETESLSGLAERSAIAGATTYGLGKAGEVADLGKKAYAEKFGMDALENLGMAGKTDPLLSSLTKDMSTAQAGASDVLGNLGSERLPLNFASTTDYDTELAMLFDDIAGQEQIGQNVVGGGVLNYNQGGIIPQGRLYGMNRTPEGMMQAVYEMTTEDGNRYYLGESLRPQLSLSSQAAKQKAMQRAVKMPQDSISFEMAQQILNPKSINENNKKGLMGMLGFNKGGYVEEYKDGGMAKKKDMGYFDREFPKDSFKAMIQEAVYKGELDPREGLQHILNKQQKDFMKSKGDTSNALYKRLQEAGYSKGGNIEEYRHGGLIDMNSYARRIL